MTRKELLEFIDGLDQKIVEEYKKHVLGSIEDHAKRFKKCLSPEDDAKEKFEAFMTDIIAETPERKLPKHKMIPVRVLGERIGRIDEELLKEYSIRYPVTNLTKFARTFIETQLLFRKVETPADLEDATVMVNNLFYHSISDYMAACMRQKIQYDIAICENCASYAQGICSKNGVKIHGFCRCNDFTKRGISSIDFTKNFHEITLGTTNGDFPA